MLYFYVALILVSEALAFAALKQFTLVRNPWLLVAGVVLYGAICFFLVKAFAYEDIGVVNVVWSVFSVLAIIAVGVLMFHESLTWKEVAGVGFAIVGVALLGGR